MSINLAKECFGGAAVLADTHSYLKDGTSRRDRKILHFENDDIAFAIADASDDGDAAKALLSTIAQRLVTEVKGWKKFEQVAKEEMTDWHKAFRKPPATIFTGAVML